MNINHVKAALALLWFLLWVKGLNNNPHSSISEQVLILTYVPWSLNNYTEKDKLRPSLPGHMPFVQINS